MAKTPYIAMDVEEEFAIGLRFSAPDLNSGETISSVEVTVNPTEGLTLGGSPSIDGAEVSEMVTAVTAGEYVVTFKTTTSAPHVYKPKYIVKVRS